MDAAVVPAGLAAMPPGPRLAVALGSVELSGVPNDRLLEVLRAQYRQLCHEQARMLAVIAEVGRCTGEPAPGRVVRLDAPDRYASEETRAALRWTRRSAECEHELSETVVRGMPLLFASWLAGDVDRQRVRVFDRHLCGLTDAQIAKICRVAVPEAPRLTTGQLAVLLRRMVIAVDPDAAARWYRKGIRERNVAAHVDHDGTVTMSANGLPADEAEAACVRLQDLAGAAKRAGHPGLIGQIRCDLFLGMLDGRFHHMAAEQVIATLIADYRPAGPAGDPAPSWSGRPAAGNHPSDGVAGPGGSSGEPGESATAEPGGARTATAEPGEAGESEDSGSIAPPGGAEVSDDRVGIEIRVGLGTLLSRDEHPAEIPGLGLLPAADARRRVALQRRAEWRFAVTDADGHLVAEGLTRRRPDAVNGHHVRRDGPPGGIVELHLPAALLQELATGWAGARDGWAGVVADIAEQYAQRDDHLRDLDSRPDDRLPGAALRRHSEIRDRTCTFIGCRRRAHTCEQDHTDDHEHGGETVSVNIGPACDHDHDVKHRGGWQVEQPEPGTFVWRSPLGGEYHTGGEWLLPEMPEPEPVDLGPNFDRLAAVVDGPILRRSPPGAPRPPPPAPRTNPDQPPF